MLGFYGAVSMSRSLPLPAVVAWSLFPAAWVTGHLHWTGIRNTELLMMAGNLVAKVSVGFKQVQPGHYCTSCKLDLCDGVAWLLHSSCLRTSAGSQPLSALRAERYFSAEHRSAAAAAVQLWHHV